MKKFFFTFLALSLFSTLSCLPSEVQRSREDNQRFFDIYGAIVKLVDQLVKTVQNKLNDLVNETAGVILGGIEKIEAAIQQAISDFTAQVQNVQDQINSLMNETVKHCLEGLSEDLTAVQNELVANLWQCYDNGTSELEKISEFLGNYTEKNNQEFQTVKEKINECIAFSDFGDKVKCAVDASNTIRAAIENYAQNIDVTSKGIFDTIKNSVNGTFSCIEQKSEESEEELNSIVDSVVSCLAQETTTEDNGGETTTEAGTETTEGNTGTENEETTTLENESTTLENEITTEGSETTTLSNGS